VRTSIKLLNEWSILHNKVIKPLNKPKRVRSCSTGFQMSNEERVF